MRHTGVRVLLVGVYGMAALLVLGSNHFDWDVFTAFTEVERRAWRIDHELPLWSYQLCGGIERAGDPQSYGLSPFFLLVLAFGSFWGLKLQMLLSLALGAHFTARILERCHGAVPQGAARPPYAVLAALFVLGNYFMWHLLVGHLTFTNMLLALGIVHYTLKGYAEGLTRRELVFGALLGWQHYSSGFFHSVVYFLVPFFLAFGLYVLIESTLALAQRQLSMRRLLARLAGATGFHVLGIALASYKLWMVWEYFADIDRDLWSPLEVLSPGQIVLQLLVPTWDRRWLLPFDFGSLWDVHEYSAFSWLLPLTFVALLLSLHRQGPRERHDESPRIAWLATCYLAVSFSFSLGQFASFAPFALLNSLSQGETARVIGRFHVGSVLAIAMLLMRLLRRPACARLVEPAGCLVLLGLLAINLASFDALTDTRRLVALFARESAPTGPPMRSWKALPYDEVTQERGTELIELQTTSMYARVRGGQGVANCYNALPRQARPAALEPLSHPGSRYPLIDPRVENPTPECVEASHFTQNRLVLSPRCPPLTCTLVARVNPRQREPELIYSPEHQSYCWHRADAPGHAARLRQPLSPRAPSSPPGPRGDPR